MPKTAAAQVMQVVRPFGGFAAGELVLVKGTGDRSNFAPYAGDIGSATLRDYDTDLQQKLDRIIAEATAEAAKPAVELTYSELLRRYAWDDAAYATATGLGLPGPTAFRMVGLISPRRESIWLEARVLDWEARLASLGFTRKG